MAKRIYTIDREATRANILAASPTGILDFCISRRMLRQYSTLVQILNNKYRDGGCRTNPASMYQKVLARLFRWKLLVELEAEQDQAA